MIGYNYEANFNTYVIESLNYLRSQHSGALQAVSSDSGEASTQPTPTSPPTTSSSTSATNMLSAEIEATSNTQPLVEENQALQQDEADKPHENEADEIEEYSVEQEKEKIEQEKEGDKEDGEEEQDYDATSLFTLKELAGLPSN